MSLRRHVISKLFAVWFIVLIALPFTAPFKTVGLGKTHHKTHQTPTHRGVSSVVKAWKNITPPTIAHQAVSLVIGLPVEVHAVTSESRRRIAPTVLRL